MKAERSWLRLWVSLDNLSWLNIESEQCKATYYCIQYINQQMHSLKYNKI
jgi:hypothetical protein